MIIPDINVLLHAYNADSLRHAKVKAWWSETLSGSRPVGLPWHCILGFIRISTNPRFTLAPWRPSRAVAEIRKWLAEPCVEIILPGDSHAEILFGLIEKVGIAGNLTSDAHLAALAIEYHAELASTDSDFAKFPGLRWFNPSQS